jgi:uncharacterized membrane protein
MARSTQIPDSRISWPARNAPASSVVFAQNTVDIAAPPEAVWALLIDCVRWPSWYKHCSDVSLLRGGPRLVLTPSSASRRWGSISNPRSRRSIRHECSSGGQRVRSAAAAPMPGSSNRRRKVVV